MNALGGFGLRVTDAITILNHPSFGVKLTPKDALHQFWPKFGNELDIQLIRLWPKSEVHCATILGIARRPRLTMFTGPNTKST